MRLYRRALLLFLLLFSLSVLAQSPSARFQISFPASAHAQPITGRALVIITRSDSPEPRLQAGFWFQQTPIYGADINQLQPGQAAVMDAATLGYPFKSLQELPAGEYYVQALINVYTEFHRADGHTIWAHMDQWEGQQFNKSPGNLYSEIRKVRLDPAAGYDVKLEASRVIPPVEVPPDTKYVKRVKFASKLVSQFWGHPMYIGATVLLPKGYDQHPNQRYPVVYIQGHFSTRAPFGFRDVANDDDGWPSRGEARSFSQAWLSDNFPRMILVTFQHPTPFFDDSYAVNSANQGPYGDALMQELIPYLETNFRILREPWARVLTGGSTGGWESLALQVLHPEFFGGTWTFFPDPIDFHNYQMVDIYQDDSAFAAPGFEYIPPERPMMRSSEGQVLVTVRQMSLLEEVLGSHGRSGQQYEEWEAAYGPVGPDGYPRPVWDKLTGKIDHEVANYMRDHGFDLGYDLEKNWPKIGPNLVGKLHLFCGDMDNYYLNLAVYRLEKFLANTKDPYYAGSFDYGRPMKGHGWSPYTPTELVKVMAAAIEKNRPKSAATR
ncbi:MAG TPA: alpha/beta hydrolase-fold protein [Terriglobales bacterium]